MPELYEIGPGHSLILGNRNLEEQEDLEEKHTTTSMPSTEMSFECRPYIPGDALSKIHWKQSAKKSTLMVHENLMTSLGKKRLILDPLAAVHLPPIEREQCESTLLEAFLSLAQALYQNGMEVELYFFLQGVWHCYCLHDEHAIHTLQLHLASYAFLHSNMNLINRLSGLLLENQSYAKTFHATLFSHVSKQEFMKAKNFYNMRRIDFTQVSHRIK